MTEPDERPPEPPPASKMRRRWEGVSLRVALGIVLVASLLLGAWAYRARSLRAGIDLIRRHHGMYHYDFEYDESKFPKNPKSWAPGWLRRYLGDETLHDVSYVLIESPDFTGDDLGQLMACFPRIKSLGIRGTKITDRGLAHLRGNRHVMGLWLSRNRITDAGMDRLDPESLAALEVFDIRGTQVSDARADAIEAMLGARELALKAANRYKPGHAHFVLRGPGPTIGLLQPGARAAYVQGVKDQPDSSK